MKKKRRIKQVKSISIQLTWIIAICGGLLVAAWHLYPNKHDQLDFINERLEKIKVEKEILTEKEKELEELATEKEWEEVDNDNNK